MAVPRPLEHLGAVFGAQAGAALPPPSVILSCVSSAMMSRTRQTCVEIVDGLMVILQDQGRAEVAAGYLLPEVASDLDAEDEESQSYDAVISHSVVALRSVETYIGVLYSLLCSVDVAHLSYSPQLGWPREHHAELLEIESGHDDPYDDPDDTGYDDAAQPCQDHCALFHLDLAAAPEYWHWCWKWC